MSNHLMVSSVELFEPFGALAVRDHAGVAAASGDRHGAARPAAASGFGAGRGACLGAAEPRLPNLIRAAREARPWPPGAAGLQPRRPVRRRVGPPTTAASLLVAGPAYANGPPSRHLTTSPPHFIPRAPRCSPAPDRYRADFSEFLVWRLAMPIRLTSSVLGAEEGRRAGRGRSLVPPTHIHQPTTPPTPPVAPSPRRSSCPRKSLPSHSPQPHPHSPPNSSGPLPPRAPCFTAPLPQVHRFAVTPASDGGAEVGSVALAAMNSAVGHGVGCQGQV